MRDPSSSLRALERVVGALLGLVLTASGAAHAQNGPDGAAPTQGRLITGIPDVIPARVRPAAINRMLEERLTTVLPRLMRETGIDLWLVINREYNEDPVFWSLVPAPIFAARRTTMLVLHDRGEDHGVDLLTVNRYPLGALYRAVWQGSDLEEQWQALAQLIAERQPRRIGINTSRDWPVADGLSYSLHEELLGALEPELRERVTSAERLAVRWLETRSPRELEVYPQIVAIARGVISEAFSNRTITPGVTTTDDVAWAIAERFAALDLPIWFQPSVNAQRLGEPCASDDPFCGQGGDNVIARGDVLHTDVGFCYLRLCTDTQEMAYVLRSGETEVPPELRRALARGNRWQDTLTAQFALGRTGNEVLASALERSSAEGLRATIYTHPLGFFGHAPGPTIGMWDDQGPTPIRGDWPLHASTAYSIEGSVRVPLELWDGQDVMIKLEQDAIFDGDGVWYLAGRQVDWHVIE